MEGSGNIPMAPPLPNSTPPQIKIVSNGTNGDHQHHHLNSSLSNGGSGGAEVHHRQELMSDIRNGVKLKASRDQILHLSVRITRLLWRSRRNAYHILNSFLLTAGA